MAVWKVWNRLVLAEVQEETAAGGKSIFSGSLPQSAAVIICADGRSSQNMTRRRENRGIMKKTLVVIELSRAVGLSGRKRVTGSREPFEVVIGKILPMCNGVGRNCGYTCLKEEFLSVKQAQKKESKTEIHGDGRNSKSNAIFPVSKNPSGQTMKGKYIWSTYASSV